MKCEICGKEFEPRSRNQRTCSKECSRKWQKMIREHPNNVNFKRYSTRYHSESLSEKCRTWGNEYGKHQAEETLKLVGKVKI